MAKKAPVSSHHRRGLTATGRELKSFHAHNRSRITNRSALLPGVDGRCAIALRFRDVTAALVSDQGGLERMSEARLQLCRRFAAAAVLAEQLEAAFARGETIDIGQHAQLVSSMVRVSTRIGVNRRAKEILPTLEHYLETRRDVDQEADDEDEQEEREHAT